eukprot:1940924-Prymnesium_polylepis.1
MCASCTATSVLRSTAPDVLGVGPRTRMTLPAASAPTSMRSMTGLTRRPVRRAVALHRDPNGMRSLASRLAAAAARAPVRQPFSTCETTVGSSRGSSRHAGAGAASSCWLAARTGHARTAARGRAHLQPLATHDHSIEHLPLGRDRVISQVELAQHCAAAQRGRDGGDRLDAVLGRVERLEGAQ